MTDRTPGQVIADELNRRWRVGYRDGESTDTAIVAALRAAGLLLGPDKVAVDREALRHVLRYGFGHGPCQICTSVSAALSEPQPKPEGTS